MEKHQRQNKYCMQWILSLSVWKKDYHIFSHSKGMMPITCQALHQEQGIQQEKINMVNAKLIIIITAIITAKLINAYGANCYISIIYLFLSVSLCKHGYTHPQNHKALSHELSTKYKEVKRKGTQSFQKEGEGKENLPKPRNACMCMLVSINRIIQNGAVKEKIYILYRRNINSITY